MEKCVAVAFSVLCCNSIKRRFEKHDARDENATEKKKTSPLAFIVLPSHIFPFTAFIKISMSYRKWRRRRRRRTIHNRSFFSFQFANNNLMTQEIQLISPHPFIHLLILSKFYSPKSMVSIPFSLRKTKRKWNLNWNDSVTKKRRMEASCNRNSNIWDEYCWVYKRIWVNFA